MRPSLLRRLSRSSFSWATSASRLVLDPGDPPAVLSGHVWQGGDAGNVTKTTSFITNFYLIPTHHTTPLQYTISHCTSSLLLLLILFLQLLLYLLYYFCCYYCRCFDYPFHVTCLYLTQLLLCKAFMFLAPFLTPTVWWGWKWHSVDRGWGTGKPCYILAN